MLLNSRSSTLVYPQIVPGTPWCAKYQTKKMSLADSLERISFSAQRGMVTNATVLMDAGCLAPNNAAN